MLPLDMLVIIIKYFKTFKMEKISICLTLFIWLFITSCSTKETISPQEGQINAQVKYFHLLDTLQKITYNAKSWREVDNFYRNEIAPLNSGDLTNQGIFWLSYPSLNFSSEANISSIEYYLQEAEDISFNINLRQLIPMLERVKSKWGEQKISKYAKLMYDKNTKYWNEHFKGQTVYLEINEQALNDLISFQIKSN